MIFIKQTHQDGNTSAFSQKLLVILINDCKHAPRHADDGDHELHNFRHYR